MDLDLLHLNTHSFILHFCTFDGNQQFAQMEGRGISLLQVFFRQVVIQRVQS